jgi:glycosyltransferase involved in cell wall biosynthesis
MPASYKPLRILFVSKNIPVPGRESNPIILELAEKLRNNCALEVDVLFPKERIPYGFQFFNKYKHLWQLKPWRTKNSTIYPIPYTRIPIPNLAFSLFTVQNFNLPKQLQGKTYNLIHAHYLLPDALIALALGKKLKVPVVASIRGSDQKLLSSVSSKSPTFIIAQHALRKVNQLVTFNSPMRTFIQSISKRDSALIPHGIEKIQLFHEREKEIRDIDVIVVASAIKLKRIDWVIKAFRNKASPNQRLLIVGDGPERPILEKQAAGRANFALRGYEVFEQKQNFRFTFEKRNIWTFLFRSGRKEKRDYRN